MNHIAIAKLVIDCLLVASVVFLAMRALRGGGATSSVGAAAARELRDLEISLKTLLRDADVSSQGLNSSLSRQQRNLEQLLADISGTERRVADAIDEANRAASRRRTEIPPSAQPSSTSYEQPARVTRPSRIDSMIFEEPQGEPALHIDSRTTDGRPYDFSSADLSAEGALAAEGRQLNHTTKTHQPTSSLRQGHASHAVSAPAPRASSLQSQVNVFGEPIGAAAQAQSSQLRQSKAPTRAPSAVHTIAERVVPAPTPAPTARTKAPIYRQQTLAQQVEVERAVESLNEAKSVMSSIAQQRFDESESSDQRFSEERFVPDAMPTDVIPQSASEAITSPDSAMSEPQESEVSSEPATVINRDPRLGVLGTVRRHTQVL